MDSLILTVPEAAAVLRVSKSEAYAMAARGELPVLRMGRRVVVPRRALDDWIEARTETAA